MPGSSMPNFGYLTEQERRDVVTYLKSLTVRTDKSGGRVNLFEAAASGTLAKPVEVPPEPTRRLPMCDTAPTSASSTPVSALVFNRRNWRKATVAQRLTRPCDVPMRHCMSGVRRSKMMA
jgi:hypothetical protein